MKFGHQLSRFLIQSPLLAVALGGLVLCTPLAAQPVCSNATGWDIRYNNFGGTSTSTASCTDGFKCEKAKSTGPVIEKVVASCDPNAGPCAIRLRVPFEFPGNLQNIAAAGGIFGAPTPVAYWFQGGTPPPSCAPRFDVDCGQISICGSFGIAQYTGDFGETSLVVGSVSCSDLTSSQLTTFSISVFSCESRFSCPQRLDLGNIDLTPPAVAKALGCLEPPKSGCPQDSGGEVCCLGPGGPAGGGGGAGGPGGPGGSSPAGGGGGASPPGSGPGAYLHYFAGGVGNTGFPGTAVWTPTLGRFWSHDYAERIVPSPDETHVWLINRFGTFREFSGKQASGLYATVSPSDEKRKLYWLGTGAGWEWRDLDGTVEAFDASGRWTQTTDRAGNAKVASYDGSGRLSTVAFPDGRGESFAYPTGKLGSITEIGIGGVTRTWQYQWTGDDLTRISRPDGTAWKLTYGDAAHPGYMTRMELVGTDGSTRVEAAWAYDSHGNVISTWKGDTSATGANAADVWSFSFDDPVLPTTAVVTDPLGKVATYTFSRDPVSKKPRLLAVSGACPTCSVGPNAQLSYGDAANPLRPTQKIDGRGTRTIYTWNADGLPTSKTEAFGTPLERTTTWEYDGPFPALLTRTEVPSTSGSGTRATVYAFDPAGNVIGRAVSGVEAGSAFSYATTLAYNSAGQALLVDPPGYGSQDQISLTYDPARGSLLPLTRTDPLVGTTTFSYDGLNRLVDATDPNGVTTETSYDALSRVTTIAQKGATPAGDLVTASVYNVFGDLTRTVLPRGNVVEYGYDTAGRIVTIETRPDAVTPGERVVYTLDATGNRTREEKQRWNGTAWILDAADDYLYSSRCHLDKIVHSDGSVREFSYDCEDNLEKVWDELHASAGNPPTQMLTYDVLNRLSSVSRPWTGGTFATTSYTYDAQSHVARVTDANGTVTDTVYSDRDLKTRETSEVAGTTQLAYNEHGQMVTRTDARNVTLQRSLDALDRVIFADYPDNALDTTYTYDDPAVPFSKGRLTAITRGGTPIAYSYDRFGRILQDGALGFAYDANGNIQSVGYPGGITAAYGYDFADRPASLSFQDGGGTVQPLASGASYLASGPLTSLVLGNGLTESRTYTDRAFPTRITVAGHLDWTLTPDSLGNITSIADALNSGAARDFAYQDGLYFLTQGNGPWGARSWTYDKAGNRASETRDGVTDTYVYAPNSAGGNSPRLAQVTLGGGGAEQLFYDADGGLTFRSDPQDKLRYSYDAEEFLAQLRSDSESSAQGISQLGYDGRGLLASFNFSPFAAGTPARQGTSTFSSQGVLYHRSVLDRRGPSSPRNQPQVQSDAYVFYFGDRPLAVYEKVVTTPAGGSPSTSANLSFLTTDAIGTPILATSAAGSTIWQGGFEPFGDDWNGAQAAGVFLRLPGQWSDSTWNNPTLPSKLVQNTFRWYEPRRGRYDMADPINSLLSQRSRAVPAPAFDGVSPSLNAFAYVDNQPLTDLDPLGLGGQTRDCGNGCTVRIERDPHKGLHANWECPGGLKGCIKPNGDICEPGRSYIPPDRIIQCLKKDKRFTFKKPIEFRCPEIPKLEIKPQYVPAIVIGGVILTCILCPECCPLVVPVLL
jgi:RHS repeat-associated protein